MQLKKLAVLHFIRSGLCAPGDAGFRGGLVVSLLKAVQPALNSFCNSAAVIISARAAHCPGCLARSYRASPINYTLTPALPKD